MNRSILFLCAAAVALSACGIKRPLVRPSEIPAYEKKRQDKLDKLKEEPQPPQVMLQQQGAA